MNPSLETLIDEALSYAAEAFDDDQPVSGADLVDWFGQWRKRAQAIRRSRHGSSRQRTRDITATQLREAIDALNEAAETRRNDAEFDPGHESTSSLIANTYDHTARVFTGVRRILERDQAVLRPDRSQTENLKPSPRFQIVIEDGIVLGVRLAMGSVAPQQLPSFIVREYESDGSLDDDHVSGVDAEGREYYDHDAGILEPESFRARQQR